MMKTAHSHVLRLPCYHAINRDIVQVTDTLLCCCRLCCCCCQCLPTITLLIEAVVTVRTAAATCAVAAAPYCCCFCSFQHALRPPAPLSPLPSLAAYTVQARVPCKLVAAARAVMVAAPYNNPYTLSCCCLNRASLGGISYGSTLCKRSRSQQSSGCFLTIHRCLW